MAFRALLTFSSLFRIRLVGLAAAVLLAQVVWVVAFALGRPLLAPANTVAAEPVPITPMIVALASLLPSVLGWAALVALERLTPHARRIWLTLALLVLAASLPMGPLRGTDVTIANRAALALMHLIVGAFLIVLYQTSEPRRRRGSAAAHAAHRPQGPTESSSKAAPPLVFGNLYPCEDIVAVIDDVPLARQAEAALHAVGVPQHDSDVLEPEDVIRRMHTIERRRGWFGRLAAAISRLVSDDGAYMRTYRLEAERGHALVVVHAATPTVRESVRRVLHTHGAHGMRHYGRFAVTELS